MSGTFFEDTNNLLYDHPLYAYPALALFSGAFLYVTSKLVSLVLVAVVPLVSGTKSRLVPTAKAGEYAVVTGASDGIGKEFAVQLAAAGFGVILIARNASKLAAVEAECDAATAKNSKNKNKSTANSGRKHVSIVFDFAHSDDAAWAALEQRLAAIDAGTESPSQSPSQSRIALLVNNVAANHAYPEPFLSADSATIDTILRVNVEGTLRITRPLLQRMVQRGAGYILNIGSMAGRVPSALLASYSASKAFLRFWSIALSEEVGSRGVHVEHVNTYFVATNMSKIRKTSWLAPSPKNFVRAVLAQAGTGVDTTPYPSHALLNYWFSSFIPESWLISSSTAMHEDIRKRALAKIAREANKKSQ